MSLTLIKSAAGFALLAVLAAGCGTAVTAQHAPAKPAASASDHQHQVPVHALVSTPPAAPATSAPVPPANPIPQGNGGDQDADNNGGPSDGDGNI
jgi:hypothetical protein